MRNFDIIKDISGLNTVYKYCSTAEDFQVVNPIISAQNARLALETMVKTVYRLKGWQIGERASLLSLTTDERFTAFITSEGFDEACPLCAQNRKQCRPCR